MGRRDHLGDPFSFVEGVCPAKSGNGGGSCLATENTELVFPCTGKLEQERVDSRKEKDEGRFGSPLRL